MTTAYNSGYCVALALKNAAPVYFRQIGKDEVNVVDPRTGEAQEMTTATFRALFVPRWDCPPALKEKAAAVPDFSEWNRERLGLEK